METIILGIVAVILVGWLFYKQSQEPGGGE